MEPKKFIELAEQILGDKEFYEDDKCIICRYKLHIGLEITRKEMPEISDYLRVTNPTTIVMNGRIIRHHGEHKYLVEHFEKLCEDMKK